MHKKILLSALLFLIIDISFSQANTKIPAFKDWFQYRTLRFDFNLAGDKSSETVYPVGFRQEPFWGGPTKNLIDVYNYGTYRFVATDSATGDTIFIRGFANLFQEWQGTPEAKSLKRSYPQVILMPYPKKTIQLSIEKRAFETGLFHSLFTIKVNPQDYFISHESPLYFPSVKFHDSGDPSEKVDVAFIAEGYTKAEMDKFREDAKRIGESILSIEPYSSNSKKFNFYAVESVSEESGTDIPGEGIYENTCMNTSFYTFNTDRYLTTSDLPSVYNAAANVPCDAIIILVNSKRYGGGGFFNQYAATTVDNEYSFQVAVHEFGHSFAGLADEYVGSVNYSDFYNTAVEPWEPNITTNIDFKSKWKEMVSSDTPLPTPRKAKFADKVGMFEGGGYMARGVYSPMMDCRMNTNEAPGFCKVCQQAIIRMIKFYCE